MRTDHLFVPVDYESLGLKAGLEIHHQILTEKKMFCNCPARVYSTRYDGVVLRHMRPTLSELGEYDGTALMEFKTRKEVIYLLNSQSVCTYEMDDTPPFPVNQEGLEIVIEISLLLGCKIVDEMHIARKQYLDGSIPTGFQRTAVVGVGGEIPYRDRKIRIIQVTYEEDACRQVSDIRHRRVYRTDRLGIPLVEVITHPDMKTPYEVAEVSRIIGRLLRATGKVRRGIGAVRQDVNVSVEGGSRVEIKGVPQFGLIPRLVHNEAIRQKALLNLRKELIDRGVTAAYNPPKFNLTEALRESACKQFSDAIARGETISAILLPDLKASQQRASILLYPVQPGRTFADEIAGRVRVIACLDTMPNLFHLEAYPSYPGSERDISKISSILGASERDSFVVVWGPNRDVQTALQEVNLRILDAVKGVPNETRQVLPDGTTDFERILPGPNRMYPDTDSPPVRITQDRVNRIKAFLPDVPWKRQERYRALGVPPSVASELAISARARLFDTLINEFRIEPKFAATVLTEKLKSLKRKGYCVAGIPDSSIIALFEQHRRLGLNKRALALALEKLARSPQAPVNTLLPQPPTPDQLHSAVQKCLSERKFTGRDSGSIQKKINFYLGSVMRMTSCAADPTAVRTIIRKLLE